MEEQENNAERSGETGKLEYIHSNRHNSVIQGAIHEKSFKNQIKDHFGTFPDFDKKHEEPPKEKLEKILYALNPLLKEEIKIEVIPYQKVRQQIRREKRREKLFNIGSYGGLLAGMGGIVLMSICKRCGIDLIGDIGKTILSTGGLSLGLSFLYAPISYYYEARLDKKNKNRNAEKKKYENFLSSAGSIDYIIQKGYSDFVYYKKHFEKSL